VQVDDPGIGPGDIGRHHQGMVGEYAEALAVEDERAADNRLGVFQGIDDLIERNSRGLIGEHRLEVDLRRAHDLQQRPSVAACLEEDVVDLQPWGLLIRGVRVSVLASLHTPSHHASDCRQGSAKVLGDFAISVGSGRISCHNGGVSPGQTLRDLRQGRRRAALRLRDAQRLPRNSYYANQPVMCRGWLVLGGSALSLEIDIL